MRDPHDERILILDFGSPTTQLIARRIRELNVYCEIHPCTVSDDIVRGFAPQGIILSGGPEASVDEADIPAPPRAIFDLGVPLLGIGYGSRLIASMMGGRAPGDQRQEETVEAVQLIEDSELFRGFAKGETFEASMGHGRVETLPEGFVAVAKSPSSNLAAMAHPEKRIFGLHFHPESQRSKRGGEILANFVHRICGCSGTWSMAAFAENAIRQIKAQVGDGVVICGLSGGVDSAVAALLIHRAIGDQLRCIFVDHGLLRTGERDQVREVFENRYHVPLAVVEAEERFLGKLAGVTDPEAKRKIIGHEFVAVFDEAAAAIEDARFLAQGTLYSDVIESVSFKGSHVAVKSHHNVGGLPETMKLALVEPLRELFKDEVRQLGRELGLPEHIVNRQPFPGPGLGIRCLGDLTKTRLDVLRNADWIVREEIEKAGLTTKIWQAFAVLLPVQSVGVTDGKRTYEETCVIRAVDSVDAMTAGWSRIPYEILEKMSSRICQEVRGINRVVYDISSKPPATIEWE